MTIFETLALLRQQNADLLDTCEGCDRPYVGPPLRFDDWTFSPGFCSTTCRDNSMEAVGMREAQRRLQ